MKNSVITNEYGSQIGSYGLEKKIGYLGIEKDVDPIEFKSTDMFHIGQSYEREPCNQVICKICGGEKFYVGSEEYFTAIKCVNCNYEISIHEG